MNPPPDRRQRRSIRLQDYDYSEENAYFVTICAQGRSCLFGEVVDEAVLPNAAGHMIEREWGNLPQRFPFLELDAFVVMPNHVHGILVFDEHDAERRALDCTSPDEAPGEHKVRPYSTRREDSGVTGRPKGTLEGTLGRVIQAFKSITTNQYTGGVRRGWRRFSGRLWQRNYHEHIIRAVDELTRIQQYIADNPAYWAFDRENPDAPPGPRDKPWEPPPTDGT